MEWKEFFKPRLPKIIIFFIIVVIAFYLEALTGCMGPGPEAGPLACLGTFSTIAYVIINPFMALAGMINGRELIYLFTTIFFLILQILYVYTISCLIYSLVGKIRAKKEQQL